MLHNTKAPVPLLFDLYEFTMAQGFLESGIGNQRAIFHLFFRRLPSDCSFAVAAGLAPFMEWLQNLQFNHDQLEGLSSFNRLNGQPLFKEHFLKKLENWKNELDIYAMPEGTIAFPHQPLVRIEGPLWQAQILETALLNIVNFSTLVTSLTVPIIQAAKDIPVWEFGARRAQGPNGAALASRSAWLAGCAGTSLVEAALQYAIPAMGTMAHSWVMAYESEQEAFDEYASLYPEQTTLLIDTFDLQQGTLRACRTAQILKAKGSKLQAVRIDSGDLLEGSRLVRQILNDHGWPSVKIILSGDLSAEKIATLQKQGAPVDIYGVGTEIACAAGDPHLTGVYKLAALQLENGEWKGCAKQGSDLAKRSEPGRRSVRRCFNTEGNWCRDETVDLLHLERAPEEVEVFPSQQGKETSYSQCQELLLPVMIKGNEIQPRASMESARELLKQQMKMWGNATHLRV